MIKLISRFCTLQKYYPTKYVAPNLWVNQKYIPIFKQKELSPEEQKQKIYLRMAKLVPITLYSSYWLFFGSLDIIHTSAFLGLFFMYSKSRLTHLQQEAKKPEYIYMDKDGKEYVIIYKLNASEPQSKCDDQKLREIFKLNENQGLLKFNVNDFTIVNSAAQPKSEYEFYNLFVLENSEEENIKRPHNMFELDINQKLVLIKFTQNEYSGMNEYLNALMSKKQIIIK
ncbi:unnamed protein product (macronuclear) [Paramecium tetraurelia]|uniref:Transmembrane protein n=1 Tax=Paramecium tetraurelia TaxID=5888 RepID=A0CX50_PARTE|nr:uncharacterized protein GSPATT00001571001 [Paramecium tetraurelia]CAK75367.1 unnamed protein product [Paramecium tetraurelia]|eukprot:XP_001442764.1 hypothetical protein (macronuclear) [Paramecium tetraurelia strain d4-2]